MAAGLAAALPIGAAAAPPGTADIQAVIDAAIPASRSPS